MPRALSLALLLTLLPAAAWAQGVSDAEVLPQGSGGLAIQPLLGYGPGTLQRFGRGWQVGRESLIADFNGINLSELIAGGDAELLETVAGGTLGVTRFDGTQRSFGINFLLAFGVTERLTFVGLLPYQNVNYTLRASLEGATSNLRVKDPEALDCGDDFDLAANFDDIVEDGGESYTFNIGDLNRALISKCFSYRPVIDGVQGGMGTADRNYSGFRDLILGAKYQFFRGRDFNLAALGYVVFPTGKQDDPDDLFDVRLGDGQWDAALLAAISLPFGKRFRLGASAGYEISFADTFTTRLGTVSFSDDLENQLARGEISEAELFDRYLDDGQLVPVATRFDRVDIQRKLGDTLYLYSYLNFQIVEWLSVGVSVNALHHFRDAVNDIGARPEGTAPYQTEDEIRAEVDRLVADGEIQEENRITELRNRFASSAARKRASYAWRTVRGNLVAGVGVNFNFLGPFLRGEFPVPLLAQLSVSRFIAGQNLDTPDAVQATLIIPFVVKDVRDPAEYGYDDEVGGGTPWP